MEVELLGKSVNVPKFLEVLEGRFKWFVSHILLLAEKHFEDPESKKIYIAIVLIGDYLWDIYTVRFEEVVYEKERTRRRKITSPPSLVLDQALGELRAAYEEAKELPPRMKKRLAEARPSGVPG